jgi:hypothetical protein
MLVFPFFILWAVLIPGGLFYLLWKNKDYLKLVVVKIKYSFLYSEY